MLSYPPDLVQAVFSRLLPLVMPPRSHRSSFLTALFLGAATPSLHAQAPDTARSLLDRTRPLVTPGSWEDDWFRVQQIVGEAPTDGYLIRSPHAQTPALEEDSTGLRWAPVAPRLRVVRNSRIPFSLNDGAMWAGRGVNMELTAGIRARYGRLSIVLAPQILVHQNEDFQTIDYPFDDRSRFASPWHTQPESLDLPLRFGDESFTVLSLGQSTVAVDGGPVEVGASTENQWWGPGIRNAIVMSNNAAGIPHLFLRTSSPVFTRVGAFEAKWMVGALTESDYFDRITSNDTRSISAFAATFQPVWEPNLTLGLARAVYAPVEAASRTPFRLFDVFRDVGRPNALPATDPTREPGPDQIFSLFGRWILPESGVEIYSEWARHERPVSVRDFLVSPNHTQGYTLGLQWATPVTRESLFFRLQSELTNLEQSATFRQRRVTSYYESRPVPQGYTQRGQVIGASIGPGASSQWIAADLLSSRGQFGVFAGRIRWENDAYYVSRPGANILSHDVSVFRGVRGGYRFGFVDVFAEMTFGERLNYLFQNRSGFIDQVDAVDKENTTFRLVLTPGTGG